MTKSDSTKPAYSGISSLPDESYLLSLGLNSHIKNNMSIASCYLQDGRSLIDQIKQSTQFNDLNRVPLSYSRRR